jgi:hypothetical protein
MRTQFSMIILATTAIACSAAPTAACDFLIRPVLVGRLIQRDAAGCLTRVDSIYSNVAVLADTFRVCGSDTVKVSKAWRKFENDAIPRCT